jgi:hypothetical protein
MRAASSLVWIVPLESGGGDGGEKRRDDLSRPLSLERSAHELIRDNKIAMVR